MRQHTPLPTEMRRRAQRVLSTRNFRRTLRSDSGAIDLASIMVGVIVIGVIAGVIAATVFAVIPWSQNEAAKQSLDAVKTSESVAQTQGGKYLDFATLVSTKQIQASTKVNVLTNAAGDCYAAASKSAAGAVYVSTDLKPNPALYAAGTTTSACTDLVALVATVGGPDPAAAPLPNQFATVTTMKRTATDQAWKYVASSYDGTRLTAAVPGGYVYLSTDSGATWTANVALGIKNWSNLITSDDGKEIVVGVGSSYLYTSTDTGATWAEHTSFGVGDWSGLAVSNDGKIISVSQGNWTQKLSVDGGLSWYSYSSKVFDSFSASAGGNTIVGRSSDGFLYKSTDAGVTFGSTRILGTTGLYIMGQQSVSDDGKTIVVATAASWGSNPGYLKRSVDGGATWADLTAAGFRPWSTLTASADGTKIVAAVAGVGGYLYSSTDSGNTWVERRIANSNIWKNLASSADGSKILAADGKGLYTFVYGP
jgi:type II secretory pathway pseudopilin PulG